MTETAGLTGGGRNAGIVPICTGAYRANGQGGGTP